MVGDEEDRFGDPPADRPVFLEMASPTERRQEGVVERGAGLEIRDLQEDVVQHRGIGRLYARYPGLSRGARIQSPRGVQRKKRTARTRPATPQIATTRRWFQAIAEPWPGR